MTPAAPWGFIVTRTLHLCHGDFNAPLCRDERVKVAIANLRSRWAQGDRTQRLFGNADGRPVCRRCIAAARRKAARLIEEADNAEAWNEARP